MRGIVFKTVCVAALSVLVVSCFRSYASWEMDFDEVFAAAQKKEEVYDPLTFTFVDTVPDTITLGASYSGPVSDDAEYDAGDGIWRKYASNTIPIYGQYISFRGDWRKEGDPFGSMFRETFTTHCATLSGSFSVKEVSSGLFHRTFQDCAALVGSIPKSLFREVVGPCESLLFFNTFLGCSGLSGAIPPDLFSGLTGAQEESPGPTDVFSGTFSGCSGLTGAIPAGLFSAAGGRFGRASFYYTFYNCKGLTHAEDGWIGEIFDLRGGNEFANTFRGISPDGTKPSARVPDGEGGFAPMYVILFEAFPNSGYSLCFRTGVGHHYSDDAEIPSSWK